MTVLDSSTGSTVRPVDPWHATIPDSIGDTPLIRVDGVWVKLEFLNPSGSIKARIAKYLIEKAEAEGLLQPGDTIVEASSGNTGNAMSMVAAVKGYRMLVIMPDGMSPERAAISTAFGAQVMTLGDFQVTDALAKAREFGAQPGYFAPQQFDNEWNVEENRVWLGAEAIPARTHMFNLVRLDGEELIVDVGFGGSFVPPMKLAPGHEAATADGARHRGDIDALVSVDSEQAIAEMRRLAKRFGLFVGPSSGAHLVAARTLRQEHDDIENVVTFFCDEGEKYINDYFLT